MGERAQNVDDTDLLQRARQGEPDAAALLFQRHRPLLMAIVRHRGVAAQDAEDIVQMAYQRFVRCLHRIERPDAFLVTIAVNLARNQARDARVEQHKLGLFVRMERQSPSPTPGIEARVNTRIDLRTALRHAGQRCTELLERIVVREVTYTEEAEATGVPRGSLGPAVMRCLRRMRSYLSRRGYAAPANGARH